MRVVRNFFIFWVIFTAFFYVLITASGCSEQKGPAPVPESNEQTFRKRMRAQSSTSMLPPEDCPPPGLPPYWPKGSDWPIERPDIEAVEQVKTGEVAEEENYSDLQKE